MNRIFVYNGNGNTCREAPLATNGQKIVYAPIEKRSSFPVATVKAQGFHIISQSELKKYSNMNTGLNAGSNNAFDISENVYGTPQIFREETPSIGTQDRLLELTICNLDPTQSHEFVWGDHHGMIADKLQLTQLSSAIVVDGTFGYLGLAQFKQNTGANPHRIHSIHITAYNITTAPPANGQAVNFNSDPPILPTIATQTPTTDFFNQGFIKDAMIDPTAETIKDDKIKFSMEVSAQSFNQNIRFKKDFRKIIDGYSGLHFKMPPLSKIHFSTYLRSVHQSYGMKKTENWG